MKEVREGETGLVSLGAGGSSRYRSFVAPMRAPARDTVPQRRGPFLTLFPRWSCVVSLPEPRREETVRVDRYV
jgi:hypothetical protein